MAIADIITRGLGLSHPPHWILTAGLGPADVPPPPVVLGRGYPSMRGFILKYVNGYEGYVRLAQALEAANFWDGLEIHLYKNNIVVSGNTVIGDLTEADYDGYAAVTLATPTPIEFLGTLGDVKVLFPSQNFQPTGSVTPNTIYGYWIQSTWGGSGDRPLTIATLDAPVVLASPFNALVIEPAVLLGQPRGQ